MDYTIRTLTKDDYKLYKKAWKTINQLDVENRPDLFKKERYTFLDYIDDFGRRGHKKFGAFLDGEMIGCVEVKLEETEYKKKSPYIYTLFVVPEHRNQGVATKLLEKCIEYYEKDCKLGECNILIDVYGYNKDAIKLYEKFGFVPRKIEYELKLKR